MNLITFRMGTGIKVSLSVENYNTYYSMLKTDSVKAALFALSRNEK